MTFKELMYGVSLLVPVLCALAEGRKAGLLGALAALVLGAGLSICSFLMTRALFKFVSRHPELGKRNPEGFWMLLVWGLCAAMFVGISGIGMFGILAAKWMTSYVVG